MNTICIPSLGVKDSIELLDRIASSIDYHIPNKLVINNGLEDMLVEWNDRHPDWIVYEPPTGNLGVADSWNFCSKMFPDEKSWLLANEDCWFLPGQLQQICETSDAYSDEPLIYLNSSCAFYCFVWQATGKRDFGDFDANFFPSYYEDVDYRVRMRLAGKTNHVFALEGQPVVPHGKPRSGGTNYAAMQQGAGLLNRAYWRKKWGSDNHEGAGYSTPYKDQRLTVRDWVWDAQHRAEIFPLWREFISQPNPSIY